MRYGICNKPVVPLYETAEFCRDTIGPASGVADELLYGWVVKINDDEKMNVNNCARVTTEYNYSGYVDLDDLKICPDSHWAKSYDEAVRQVSGGVHPDSHWTKSYDEAAGRIGGEISYVDRNFVDILCEPKVTARLLLTLPRGSFVRVNSPDDGSDGWISLLLNDGTVGFTQACMLKPKPASPLMTDNDRLRREVVMSARSYLGCGYRWGGKTPQGIDCSGLAFMSYFENGIHIYRDAKLKAGFPVQEIPLSRMEAGDLLYFPGHVAIYLGKGQYIHATAKAGSFGVVINSLKPHAPDFRADLHESLAAVGSVFAGKEMQISR
jgi:hypothetical protein